MRNNSESPYENEGERKPENAWPEWLKLQPGLTPVHTAPAINGVRPVAILGRSFGQPCITFRIFKRTRKGSSWRDTGQNVSFSLQEFRVLLVKLNNVLTRRPELGEDRPIGRRA